MARILRQLRPFSSALLRPSLRFLSQSRTLQIGGKPNTLPTRPSDSIPQPSSASKLPTTNHDPHAYTGGRWLHRDELQRNCRYIQFDFSALCDRAIHACPGATKVVKYEKREGGFNKVFILTMDNGSRVVAKLPTAIAGPPRLTTNSEVATTSYLQAKLSLSIPKILDWNDDPSNSVGAEYIIQEYVAGIPLHQQGPKMNSEQHMLCTKASSLAMKQMESLNFPAYGSLYFSDAPIHADLKIPFEQGFCIGPHCSPIFWNLNPGEPELYGGPSSNYGPWKDLGSYSLGLIQTGYSRLPKETLNPQQLPPHQGSIQDHISLLRANQQVMQRLIEDKRVQESASPTLLHPDFHTRNIFVSEEDPTVITGIIDWQSASIEPAFIYANEIPDFAAPPEDLRDIFNEPENKDILAEKERDRKDASICYQTYEICLKLAPKLRPARLLDPSLLRLFHYSHTTWRDSAPAIRQELIELSGRWTELELQGSCPYAPTEEELVKHAADYEDFETVQKLKLWLKHSLNTNSDGWVSNDVYDAAVDAHRAVYHEWIETASESELCGEGLTVDNAKRLWPFDAR